MIISWRPFDLTISLALPLGTVEGPAWLLPKISQKASESSQKHESCESKFCEMGWPPSCTIRSALGGHRSLEGFFVDKMCACEEQTNKHLQACFESHARIHIPAAFLTKKAHDRAGPRRQTRLPQGMSKNSPRNFPEEFCDIPAGVRERTRKPRFGSPKWWPKPVSGIFLEKLDFAKAAPLESSRGGSFGAGWQVVVCCSRSPSQSHQFFSASSLCSIQCVFDLRLVQKCVVCLCGGREQLFLILFGDQRISQNSFAALPKRILVSQRDPKKTSSKMCSLVRWCRQASQVEIHLSIFLYTPPAICPSTSYLSIHLPIYPSTHLSI